MEKPHILSAGEQLAIYLKDHIRRRTWIGKLPGESWMVRELQVGRETVRAALALLETEGVLLPQGQGRQRLISAGQGLKTGHFRITMLLFNAGDRTDGIAHDIHYELSQRGFRVDIAPKTLSDLGMNVERVAKMVAETKTDAWVVQAGSSEVLGWFAKQASPAFAVFGIFSMHKLAGIGPHKFPAYRTAIRRLIELGHRRIVLLMPEQVRTPTRGKMVQDLLDEMTGHGIMVGPYNLPEWKCNPAGLRDCLDRLFMKTPPTALLVDRAYELLAVQHYLAKRGIIAPRDVSLLCSDDDPVFEWSDPPITRIRWSHSRVVRRVVRWAEKIAHGKEDQKNGFFAAEFIEGGTIGPAPPMASRRG